MLLQDIILFALWTGVVILAVAPLFAQRDTPGDEQMRAGKYDFAFFGSVLLTLLACRLFALRYDGELNIDECQFIAQALGYHRDLMPFSQDGHTCGPLNYYICMWPAYIGWPITYFTIRLTGIFLIIITIIGAVRSLAYIVDRSWSYVLAMPLITFYFFAYQPGFVHFSSELFPEALIAISGWITVRLWYNGRASSSNMFFLGLILGATPFTKLQGGPLAVFVFLIAFALLLPSRHKWRAGLQYRWTPLASLVVGAATVPITIAVLLASARTLDDSFYRYVIVNLDYGAQLWIPDPHPFPYVLYEFAHNGPQFTLYLFAMLGVTAFCLATAFFFNARIIGKPWLIGLAVVAVFWVISVWAVLKPHQAYCHYLLLLPVPTLLVAGWAVRGCSLHCSELHAGGRSVALAASCVLFSFISLPLYVFEQHVLPYPPTTISERFAPISAYVKSVTRKGDAISNWGYTPEYYVQTQLPPAVRDYSTLFEIYADPDDDYFRYGYLEDLRANRPRVIIDSVGEHYLPTWIHPIENARAASWPPLGIYLNQYYAPPVAITTAPGMPPVLVYVRKPEH